MALPAIERRFPEAEPAAAAQLATAFEMFNDLSAQLADTYRAMEERVGQLDSELHHVAEQRLRDLQEKERFAARLQSLLTLLPAGVVVLDQFGRVAECNPAAMDLLGRPLTGELWRDVIDRAFAPRSDDGHEISLKDGRRISLVTRSLDGEPGQLLLLTDLTETRELQQRLSRHQRLSEMGRMLSSLAHQIRTPLSAAMLYAGHLHAGGLTTEQTNKFSFKLLDRLQHLEQQVKDMLIFVRGDVRLTDTIPTVDLVESLQRAIEAPVAAAKAQVSLTNQCVSALIHCNCESVVGALTNLVNNALQAVGKKAEISISLALIDDAGRWISIRIQDNGPGFEAHVARRLSEPFFTTKAQGTGLGLAVVRAVADAHHGVFTITSEPGQGACAELRLPLWEQTL
ncbi:MAG: sensor histidine kinase [Verrucomicrobiaceae bacterium]|nr:sensor histidine kinase [Verrucomicrobiaceae bacterium]